VERQGKVGEEETDRILGLRIAISSGEGVRWSCDDGANKGCAFNSSFFCLRYSVCLEAFKFRIPQHNLFSIDEVAMAIMTETLVK